MHVKGTLQPLQRRSLSEHEAKRCRALSRSGYWEVFEESIFWWSPDQQRWQPLDDDILPRRRRWLVVETEAGFKVALIWEVGEPLNLPVPDTATERQIISQSPGSLPR